MPLGFWLLMLLLLRQAAYVRQRVLQTWARLVEESCVPINHWNLLLTQGEGASGWAARRAWLVGGSSYSNFVTPT